MAITLSRTLGLVVLPTAILLGLAYLADLTLTNQLEKSGAIAGLLKACPTPPTFASSSQRHYTGVPAVDTIMCIVVEFFDAALDPSSIPFMAHWMIQFQAGYAAILVEGTRSDRPWLSSPLIIGLLCQAKAAGRATPIAWILVVLQIIFTSRKGRAPLTAAQAESVLFALLVGYTIPSIALLVYKTVEVNAVWQWFPLWGAIAQTGYLAVRPASSASGDPTMKTLYRYIVLSCMIVQFWVIYSAWSLNIVQDFIAWLPSVSPPSPGEKATSLASAALAFLQWDLGLSYVTAVVAGLWLQVEQNGFKGFDVATAATDFARMVVFGPGVLIALIWERREDSLHAAKIEKTK